MAVTTGDAAGIWWAAPRDVAHLLQCPGRPLSQNDPALVSAAQRSRGPTRTYVLVTVKGSSWGPVWGRRVLTDHLQALFGVLGVDAVELLLEFNDFLRLDGDVCGLALGGCPKRKEVGISICHSRGDWRWDSGACPGRWLPVFKQVGQGFVSPSTACFILTASRKASGINSMFLFSAAGASLKIGRAHV